MTDKTKNLKQADESSVRVEHGVSLPPEYFVGMLLMIRPEVQNMFLKKLEPYMNDEAKKILKEVKDALTNWE